MIVIGIDPGFASVGYAVVELPSERIRSLGAFVTEKSDRKRAVRAADDNVRRARELAAALARLVQQYGPVTFCAESMSFPRHAGNAAKMAMCWGAIAALAETSKLSVVQASPQEIKKALCGVKSATKEEVQAALERRYAAQASELSAYLAPFRRTLHEHAYDALGAVVACLDSEVLRMIARCSG